MSDIESSAKYIEQLKANERYLLDQRGVLEQKLSEVRDTVGLLRNIHAELIEVNETLETNTNLIRDVAQTMTDLVQMMSRR